MYASADPSADYTALMCSLLLLVEGFVFVTLAAFVSAVRRVSNDAGVDSSEAVATVIGGAFGRVVGALCRAACAPCRPIARCLAPRATACSMQRQFTKAERIVREGFGESRDSRLNAALANIYASMAAQLETAGPDAIDLRLGLLQQALTYAPSDALALSQVAGF